MAKSNVERQAAYRRRNLKSEEGKGERLDVVIDLHAKRALERLARHQGITLRAMLEKLLIEAEQAIVDKLAALPGGCSEYYEGKKKAGLKSLPGNEI